MTWRHDGVRLLVVVGVEHIEQGLHRPENESELENLLPLFLY